MHCPKCSSTQMLAERLDDRRTKYKCGSCGFNEVRDERGAPLLMEVPRAVGVTLLNS